MIKSNQQLLNRIHVVLDAVVIIVSYLLAYYIRIGSPIFPEVAQGLSFGYYILALALLVPFYLVLYSICQLYVSKRLQGRRQELANIVKANTIGIFVFIIILSP